MSPDNLIQFTLFGEMVGVNLYGICMALALLAALVVFHFYTNFKKINSKVQDFGYITAICAMAGGFLFAKFFQAVYDWIEKGYFNFAGAGITAMGGFIGGTAVFLAIYFGVGHFYFKDDDAIHIKEFMKILQVAPMCITLAHAIGRIGCLTAGCCHGALVERTYQGSLVYNGGFWMNSGSYGWSYCVPTQLYEAIFLFVLFGVLSFLYFKRYNFTYVVYLIAYGAWRIFIEFFRDDHRGEIIPGSGITPSQFQSILFILGGIAILFVMYFLKWRFRDPEGAILTVAQYKETYGKKKKSKETVADDSGRTDEGGNSD